MEGLDPALIRQQLQSLAAQRDQSMQTFHQCNGAIAILQEQLQYLVELDAAAKKAAVEKEQGANEDGKVNDEAEEQAA